MKQVAYKPKAVDDLAQIIGYSREQWGDEQAERYMDGLELFCCQLPKFARLGREAGEYRRLRYERHVIFYKVGAKQVLIVRILHERMLPARHL